jgi:hypothetical protein
VEELAAKGMNIAYTRNGEVNMKLIYATFGVAAMCAVGLGAQTGTTQTKTKIEVKDGKEIKISGCLERTPGAGYILTDREGGLKYTLVTNDDLSKHLGHRIEVKGKAADKGDATVKIESTVGTSGSDKKETSSEVKGTDMAGMRYLGVKSVKMLSKSCM